MPLAGSLFASREKPFWPEPQLSRANELQSMRVKGGDTVRCWDALTGDGTAYARFLEIKNDVLACLTGDGKLNATSFVPSTGVSCCLIGKDPDKLNPTVIISCEDDAYRKRALKAIQKHQWWRTFAKANPSFLLIGSRRAPTPATSPSSSAYDFAEQVSSVVPPHDGLPEWFRINGNHLGRCGEAIQFYREQDTNGRSGVSVATIGGYLLVGGVLMGLTVAHVPPTERHTDTSLANLDGVAAESSWDIEIISSDDDDGSDVNDEDVAEHEVQEHPRRSQTTRGRVSLRCMRELSSSQSGSR